MHLRRWWFAYAISPLGTVAAIALIGGHALAFGASPATVLTLSTLEVTTLGLLISYVIGLCLLPFFLMFEERQLRGWLVYIATAAAAGVFTAACLTFPDIPGWRPGFLCAFCGTLCGVVFTVAMRTPSNGRARSLPSMLKGSPASRTTSSE